MSNISRRDTVRQPSREQPKIELVGGPDQPVFAGSDALTVLRCTETGKLATKRVRACDEGVAVESYGAGTWFSVETVAVAGIADLAAALDAIADDPTAYLIRGEPRPETERRRCRRTLHARPDGTPPAFADVPRRWVMLDFDTVEWPPRPPREMLWDWRDGTLSGLYLRSLLPAAFQRADFWWSFTCSAGFKPGVRMRLAFWLDCPTTGDGLRRWLANAPVDKAIFGANQAIYTARPVLDGVADPVPVRSGLEPDAAEVVAVPDLRPPPPPPRTIAERAPQPRHATSEDGLSWQERLLLSVARDIVRTPSAGGNPWGGHGRHNALLCGALRLSGPVTDGLISRRDAYEVLAGAAQRAGIEDAKEIARTITNGFRLGGEA